MSLSPDDRYTLEIAIQGSKDNPSALTDWETGFIASTEERFQTYGDETRFSPKQWDCVTRIYDKVAPK